jgi:predicted GIY-YIG superfamily endonuclease
MKESNMVIYKLTSPSGKIYIGKTRNFIKRCDQHKKKSETQCKYPLYNSIRKYGWNITRSTIVN